MISTTRLEALDVLADVCQLLPEVRLGQLFAHLGVLGEDEVGCTLWSLEDDQLLAILRRHRAELMARLPRPQQPAPAPAHAEAAVPAPKN